MPETVGIGLVGLGAFGQFTADIYAGMPDVRIVGIVSRDADKRASIAERLHAEGYAELDALLANPQVQCVVINTPPYLHGKEGLAVINAGKHAFIEKPLATSMADARALVDAARDRNVRLGVNYVQRFASLHAIVYNVITSGILGQVTSVAMENHASHDGLNDDHWFWDLEKSGGIFVEHGVHFFDLCAYFIDSDPAEVSGFTFTEPNGRQDRVMAAVKFANGALGTFYHAFDRAAVIERTTLRLTLEHGFIRLYGWIPERLDLEGNVPAEQRQELAELLGVPLTTKAVPAPPGVPGGTPGTLVTATLTRPDKQAEYQAAVRDCFGDFIKAIRDPAYTPLETPAAAFHSTALALAAGQSAREMNRIVHLAEVDG